MSRQQVDEINEKGKEISGKPQSAEKDAVQLSRMRNN